MKLALQLLKDDYNRLSRAISQGDATGIYTAKLEETRKAILELTQLINK
tara:strand:+ start:65 stop:211 length:147 start_codon:yes stop_codon:yes gene_type:complete